ncbi:MAG: hypothetical protein EOO38_23190 [Cytophagaceae bacterium]|jgi:hypothetical protein|nr:MAG: hypothetical protein EOO38_23190 [Cytophagaceae bacterium]
MNFDDLIRYKALHLKYTTTNMGFIDLMLDPKQTGVTGNLPMKNVCAMIHQNLFDRLSDTCALLDISKRSFIEMALIEALNKADAIMESEKLEDYLVDASNTEAA